MLPFTVPATTGKEIAYVAEAVSGSKLSGDGPFTNRCTAWFQDRYDCYKALLTTSCTHALEMSAILSGIQEGDEVIMPSFTFVSTANAFVLRGAKIRFVDIRPDTLNIDETLIEAAINEKTKAIVVVHYAGVACEMDIIMDIAFRYRLLVIEDAAQAVLSSYKHKKLGTFGQLSCFSFHETKNIHCGEGGALLVNDPVFVERAEIIREKGTNRSKFLRGQVDKYTWVDIGSSYLPSELNAAFLLSQLEEADSIIEQRLESWRIYFSELSGLHEFVGLPKVPDHCQHNGHIFFIKTKDLNERTRLMHYLKENNVQSAFHYVPLHSTEIGRKLGTFQGEDRYTTSESERILRLPLFYGIEQEKIYRVAALIRKFYGANRE